MKKIIFTLFTLIFVFSLLQAQEVEEKQRTLLTKRTATWCPPCGSWGWDLFEHLIEDNEDKAVLLAAHYSGDLTTQTAIDITSNWSAFSQPRFYLNDTDQNATSGNSATTRTNIQNQVNDAFDTAPTVNVGFNLTYNDAGELVADAKVKFFQNADGEYYLGMYLVENHVINQQASQGANADHLKVLRDAFTENTFGTLISSGAVNAGTEVDLDFAMLTADPATKDYEVAGIIWQKVGDVYEVVNVFMKNEVEEPVVNGTSDIFSTVHFNVFPNVTTGNSTIELELPENATNVELALFDALGQQIEIISKDLSVGTKERFQINPATKGLFFVRLQIEGASISKKLIVH